MKCLAILPDLWTISASFFLFFFTLLELKLGFDKKWNWYAESKSNCRIGITKIQTIPNYRITIFICTVSTTKTMFFQKKPQHNGNKPQHNFTNFSATEYKGTNTWAMQCTYFSFSFLINLQIYHKSVLSFDIMVCRV